MRLHALAFALALAAPGAFAQERDPSPHRAHASGPKADAAAHDRATTGQAGADPAATSDGGPASIEPRTPLPPITDADRAAAFPADVHGHRLHGDSLYSYFLFDRLEAFDADPGGGQAWEAKGWFGGDLDRLWLRSEGERVRGRTQSADLELLYGRSFTPWWDLLVGLRQDFRPGDPQTYAAIGVQGLAPQKFEVAATAYLGERGRTAVRIEAEYELLLTNRLILQPRAELNFHGGNDPARGIGSGLGTAEAGLRLRYEFTRRFAPYVGVVRERAFGGTADYRRRESEEIDETRFVVGLRTWF